MSAASASSSSGASVAQPAPRKGPSMLHLSLHAETLSASDVIAHLAKRHSDTPLPAEEADSFNASMGVARLTASHLELQDRGVAKVVQWLCERKETMPLWALEALRGTSAIEEAHIGRENNVEDEQKMEPVKLRRLDLSANELTSDGLAPIVDYVHSNARLTSLELQGNDVGGSPELLRPLATALQYSTLRLLDLSSNPLGPECLITLLDALRTPSLRELNLNLVLGNNTSRKEGREVAAAVARLVRVRDSPTEGAGGWAPHLERLKLNGNDLGWKGLKAIVAAIVGATPDPQVSIRRPNRSLSHVELFATMADVPASDESDAENNNTASRGTRELVFTSAHNGVERGMEQEEAEEMISATEAMLRTRIGVAGRRDVPGGLSSRRTADDAPNQAGQGTSGGRRDSKQWASAQTTASPQKLYASLTRAYWRKLLGEQLWLNFEQRSSVQRAARSILIGARILGCAASNGTAKRGSPDVFPFAALPPELRLGVVRALDSTDALSDAQFLSVVSWASSRSTIGWGCQATSLRFETLGKPDAARDESSLLPTNVWDWTASLAKSPPRDWEAAVADAPQPALGVGWGGRGGPDGTGVEGFQREPQLKAGMCAFWEATGTTFSDLP